MDVFASVIEATGRLVVPAVCLLEVFKVALRQRGYPMLSISLSRPANDDFGAQMGLDFVELVMEIETEFGVDMNAAIEEDMRTVGSAHAFLMRQLGAISNEEKEALWERLVKVIEREHDVPRARILPDARFRDDLDIR